VGALLHDREVNINFSRTRSASVPYLIWKFVYIISMSYCYRGQIENRNSSQPRLRFIIANIIAFSRNLTFISGGKRSFLVITFIHKSDKCRCFDPFFSGYNHNNGQKNLEKYRICRICFELE